MFSIRKQLISTLLLLGLVPLALSLGLNSSLTERSLLASKHSELRNFGNEIKRQIANTLGAFLQGLEGITSNPFLTNPATTAEERKNEFTRVTQYARWCSSLTLLSIEGDVVDSTDTNSVLEPDTTDQFIDCLTLTKTIISRPLIDPNATTAAKRLVMGMFVYQPVIDSSGQVVNVVRAHMTFDQIWEILRDAKIGETGSFVLTDDFGNALYHPNPDKIMEENYFKATGIDFNKIDSGEYISRDGELQIFEVQRLSEEETHTDRAWTLITRMHKADAMAVAAQNKTTSLWVGVFTLSLTGLVGLWFAARISRPITNASNAARSVADGNLDVKLTAEGPSEMRRLAEVFNQMTYQVLQHNEELELKVDSRTRSLRQSQDLLAEMTAQLRSAYESTREGILVLHHNGQILTANKRVEEIFGLHAQDLLTRSLPELKRSLCDCFKDSAAFDAAWEMNEADKMAAGEAEWDLCAPLEKSVCIYTAPVLNQEGESFARLWMFRDITEQRQLEHTLRHAQKMDAVGRLAGGVAHDFNNLLQGILGNLYIVQESPVIGADPDVKRCLHAARSAGLRAAELVKGLLGFSRQTHLSLGRCQVNHVLLELMNLVRQTFDKRINFITDLDPNAWGLLADANQIEQVLMNMAVNAKDAMPHGGDLMLSTTNVEFPSDSAELPPGCLPGQYVRVSVSDSGTGMPEEVRTKIFEPFFTTKEQGKGTGLGLATSFGIIEQHGGWITCDSVIGHGTTFHIFLPRNEVAAAEALTTEIVAPKAKGGRETILIVDDELVVRAVAEAILKKHGYNILTACDGEEAIDMLGRFDGSIDLVLMDMTMPRLSGMDTFHHMRKGVAKTVPVVICSGYLVDLSGFQNESGSIPDGFLQKPYDVEDMARTVRKVLDECAASAVV